MNWSNQVTRLETKSSVQSYLTTQKRRLLLISSETGFAEILADVIHEEMEIKVDLASNTCIALNHLQMQSYDVIIVDWDPYLKENRGAKAEVALYLEPENPKSWKHGQFPVIILSSSEREQLSFKDTDHCHIAGYVSKRQNFQNILDDLKVQLNEIFEMQLSA